MVSSNFLIATISRANLGLDLATRIAELGHHIGRRGWQLATFVRSRQGTHAGAIFGGPSLATSAGRQLMSRAVQLRSRRTTQYGTPAVCISATEAPASCTSTSLVAKL